MREKVQGSKQTQKSITCVLYGRRLRVNKIPECLRDFFQMLLQGSCQLIGAGGGFEAATNPAQAADCLIDLHTDDQSGDTLGVSRATTEKFYVGNHIVFYVDFDLTGANSLSGISNVVHGDVLSALRHVN